MSKKDAAKKQLKIMADKMLNKIEPHLFVVEPYLFKHFTERLLYNRILRVENICSSLMTKKDYLKVLEISTYLSDPVANFLDNCRINIDDEQIINNRVALLWRVNKILKLVADLGKL